ncbi:MAG: ABC transporter permease [Promethearchaeota archaeon]
MNLLKYIIKRLLISIPILLIALTITFFIGRVIPGDPFLAVFGRGSYAEHELYEFYVEGAGLNDPILIQYKNYLVNIFSGNWGNSWGGWGYDGLEVRILVGYTFPITLEIIVLSSSLAYFLGKRIGIYTATRKNKISSNILRILSSFGGVIPNFISGYILILLIKRLTPFGLLIGGIKTYDYLDPTRVTGMRLLDCLIAGEFNLFLDTAIHYLWPVLILGFQFTSLFARQTRSNMLDVLEENYIRAARAKGCSEKQIIKKHAYKVAMIPNITNIGILFPIMLSNIILIEYVFTIPGFGSLLYTSFNRLDYNTQIIGISICIIAVIIVNLITDVLYAVMDPRIRYD